MPAPLLAAAARIGTQIGKKKSKGLLSLLGGGQSDKPKPGVTSIEGMVMLIVAILVDILNIIFTLLDAAYGFGTVFAIVLNAAALFFIGGWMWMRTGTLPIKKAVMPFALNSIPLIRFFPFWVWSVWTSLDKSAPTNQEKEQKSDVPQSKNREKAHAY